MEIQLSPEQIIWLQKFFAMKQQGVLIPMHLSALAHVCKATDDRKFVEDLGLVWLVMCC